jgi:chromosome segregation ATPase
MTGLEHFFQEHEELAWVVIVSLAGLVYWLARLVYVGKSNSLKNRFEAVAVRFDGLECNQRVITKDIRGLGGRTSSLEGRLAVLEDRTARLEPLISRLDESISTHADLTHGLRVEVAKLSIAIVGYEKRLEETNARLNGLTDK